MNDEMFHLTPVDVRRTEFPKAMRGYDKDRVDHFREQVADELDRLTRQNAELDAKVKSSTEQLRAFRERDKALNEALVSAQQLRAESRDQAEREAELILKEAHGEAERIVQSAYLEAARIEEQIAALARMRRGYVKQFRVMLERQLAEIAAEEDHPDPDTSVVTGRGGGIDGAGGPPPSEPPQSGSPRSGALFRG
jgi:DivIVA domain-containing protein